MTLKPTAVDSMILLKIILFFKYFFFYKTESYCSHWSGAVILDINCFGKQSMRKSIPRHTKATKVGSDCNCDPQVLQL